MKKIAQFVLALAVSTPLITTAVASGAHYGEPNKIIKLSATGSNDVRSYVTIYNYTGFTYSTSGQFDVSHNFVSMPIGTAGSPTATGYYEIDAPDNCVSVAIKRDIDGLPISVQNPYCANYSQPLPTYHSITISPGLAANAAPVVTFK